MNVRLTEYFYGIVSVYANEMSILSEVLEPYKKGRGNMN